MVDNKGKTSLIRCIQKCILLMKMNNIILILDTRIILSFSFMIYFFPHESFGKFSYCIMRAISWCKPGLNHTRSHFLKLVCSQSMRTSLSDYLSPWCGLLVIIIRILWKLDYKQTNRRGKIIVSLAPLYEILLKLVCSLLSMAICAQFVFCILWGRRVCSVLLYCRLLWRLISAKGRL